jgi:hypothetical protein
MRLPVLLPLGLDLGRIVTGHRGVQGLKFKV